MFCPVSLCSSFSFLFPLIPQLVAADGCRSPSLVLLELFLFFVKKEFFLLTVTKSCADSGGGRSLFVGFSQGYCMVTLQYKLSLINAPDIYVCLSGVNRYFSHLVRSFLFLEKFLKYPLNELQQFCHNRIFRT